MTIDSSEESDLMADLCPLLMLCLVLLIVGVSRGIFSTLLANASRASFLFLGGSNVLLFLNMDVSWNSFP